MKYATDEAMRTGMTLQKSYIDNGDNTNARALDDAKRELKASIDQNSNDIESVSKKVDLIIGSAQYYVAEYLKGSNDNTEIRHLGNKDILKDFGFVLLDTSDHLNITTKAKRLKDNNLFRFEDGTFAPTVGITTEQYNQCMANDIYTMDTSSGKPVYTLEYQSGQFNAAVQWKKDKALIKAGGHAQELYTLVPGADGASSTYKLVTHVLRPWETTETKYTIGIANLVDMYLLDNQVGDSGAYWKGIFLEPVSWDGIDVTKHKLPPTAISPGPTTLITDRGPDKLRNFFYLYQVSDNKCHSNEGSLPNHDFYEADRTYPLVNTGQVRFMKYARSNNVDEDHRDNLPYPFAEGGYFATNVFITALELAAGTRYIHQANLFGSGISSNDGCTAANFFTSGGCRLKKVGDYEWSYGCFNDEIKNIEVNPQGDTRLISYLLTNEYPKEQCMESQMAASMATELGINPTTDPANPNYFEFYGNRYYYMNVPGFDGLQEGRMNTRVYKYVQKTVSAYSNRAPQDFDMEVVYRMSLFNGANLCGDVLAYNMGGLEMLVTKQNTEDFTYAYSLDIYAQPDQTKWHSDESLNINGTYTFPFENTYEKIVSFDDVNIHNNDYALMREGYTPYKIKDAPSIIQGECYFNMMTDLSLIRKKCRLGLLFRYNSSSYDCSPRSIRMDYDGPEYIDISGTLQALIEL